MGDDTRDTLTPEALAEIERRAKQATPGPWRVEQDWTWEVTAEEGGIVAKVPQGSPWPNGGLDARFIAAARSDVPLLCASLRAAWAERDEAWEEVEDVVAEAREIKDAQDALLAERDALRAEVKRLRGLPTVGARTGLPLPPFPALVEPCPICNDTLYPEECGESHGKPASEGPEPCSACGTPDGNTCDCLG
jgi:hypothetical protein